MASVWGELKRRNVFRVAIAYVIIAWLILQVGDTLAPALHLTDWVNTVLAFFLILGFPMAVFFAWAFELTPEGIKKEKDVDRLESVTHLTGRKLDFAIIGLMAVAILYLVLDNYVLEQAPSATAVEVADDVVEAHVAIAKTIAVLPFQNRSALAEDAYFVDGIHDDILTQLSKLSSLEKVISRTSMEQYRETTKTMPQIGQELDVAFILEGSVQRAGNTVRINAQLIDANSNAHLWADTYDRQLTVANIFAIQTEIAIAIATALRTTLSPEEQRLVSAIPTESLEAYEAYQLGIRAFARGATNSTAEAIRLFTQATTIDESFAQAWVGLANSYLLMVHLSGRDIDELIHQANVAVDEALRLDDQLGETQTALANVLRAKSDFLGAAEAFERALKLNPNDAYTHFSYANLLHDDIGKLEQSIVEYERALTLDPLSPAINDTYALVLTGVGRFDDALARYRIVNEVNPQYPEAAVQIGTIYGLALGRLDLANLWWREALARDPGNPQMPAILGLLFLGLDDDETAEFWIDRALRQAPEHPWANGAMTMLQSYRGDSERMRQHANVVAKVEPRWRYGTALRHWRVPELRDGNYDKILDQYESTFPELFGDTADVNSVTFRAAIDVAGLLILIGDSDRAAAILADCQKLIMNKVRVGYYGFWVSDVQILALQGKTDAALTALTQAVDQGWRTDWRYFFYVDPNLDGIREEPEFQAILSEVQEDMAAQLERARAMETNGELVEIPESHKY